MCSDIWLTRIDPVAGLVPQKPFRMAEAREKCKDWRDTEARMEAAEREGVRFDTTLRGNGNGGHLYGATLPTPDKLALLEYLKTL